MSEWLGLPRVPILNQEFRVELDRVIGRLTKRIGHLRRNRRHHRATAKVFHTFERASEVLIRTEQDGLLIVSCRSMVDEVSNK